MKCFIFISFLICCISPLLCTLIRITPETFKFGSDIGKVEFYNSGKIGLFQNRLEVPIPILPCKKLTYIQVNIYNQLASPNSGGAILGGSTVWSLLRMSYYFWTSDLGVELGSGVLFVSGSLLCLPTSWLATLVPYHPRSTTLLATLMILVTSGMMLLSIGISSIMGLSRALRDTNALNTSMLRAMSFEAEAVKSAFASMQLEMKCCGVNSPYDWYQYGRILPPSCCGRVWIGKRTGHCESPLYTVGCLRPARAELRMYANSLAVLGCAIIIVKAVTLFAAAYTLVTNVVERGAGSKPQPLRIACVASPLAFSPNALPNAPAHI